MISPEETLDQTLHAVRRQTKLQAKRRAQRRKIIIATSCILLVLTGIFFSQPQPQPNRTQQFATQQPIKITETYRVEISQASGSHTINISPDELAKIVFNPSVTFKLEDNLCVWKSQQRYVCLPFPASEITLDDDLLTPRSW